MLEGVNREREEYVIGEVLREHGQSEAVVEALAERLGTTKESLNQWLEELQDSAELDPTPLQRMEEGQVPCPCMPSASVYTFTSCMHGGFFACMKPIMLTLYMLILSQW